MGTSYCIRGNRHIYGKPRRKNYLTETITNGQPITNLAQGIKTSQVNNLNQTTATTNPPNPSRNYLYDDDGNLTQGYTPEGHVFTATYDAENRLKTITFTNGSGVEKKTEYDYAFTGWVGRIRKYDDGVLTSDKRLIRDGFVVIQERDENNATTREYLYQGQSMGGIGQLLSMKQNGQDYYYLYDGKGNVAAIVDSTETVVAAYGYEVFGELNSTVGTLDQPIRFSTKYYDSDTGLYDFGFRFYYPEMGKWLTRDPLNLRGGINLYAYVGGNPVNRIDPRGLLENTISQPDVWDVIAGGAAGAWSSIQTGAAGAWSSIQAGAVAVATPVVAAAAIVLATATEAGDADFEETCAAEWERAYEICADELTSPCPNKGQTGGYNTLYDCARGHVSERCGGNLLIYEK